MAKIVLRNPARALEIGANVGAAFASRSRKAASSSELEVINSYHTGKGYTWANLFNLCYKIGTKSTKTIPICTTRKY